MQYNWKNEIIYHPSTRPKNAPLSVHLTGVSMPNPNYFITHNTSSLDFFRRFQFEYVVSGKGYIEFDGETYPLSAGDFFFINKLRKVIYYSDKSDPMKKYFTTVSGQLIDGYIAAYKMTDSVIIRKIDAEQNFLNIFKSLELYGEDDIAALNTIAVEILKIIQKLNPSTHDDAKIIIGDKAQHILEYIRLNPGMPLEEIAKHFYLSKSQVIRIFTQKYHMTPMQYALKSRIATAIKYLEGSDMSINQISDAVLFSDRKYFSKVFKKHTGMTPTEYRKNKHPHKKVNIEKFLNTIGITMQDM